MEILGYRCDRHSPGAPCARGVDIHQDGPHITGGENILIEGGYIEAGDDCFPLVNVPAILASRSRCIRRPQRGTIVMRGNIGHSAKTRGFLRRVATRPRRRLGITVRKPRSPLLRWATSSVTR